MYMHTRVAIIKYFIRDSLSGSSKCKSEPLRLLLSAVLSLAKEPFSPLIIRFFTHTACARILYAPACISTVGIVDNPLSMLAWHHNEKIDSPQKSVLPDRF